MQERWTRVCNTVNDELDRAAIHTRAVAVCFVVNSASSLETEGHCCATAHRLPVEAQFGLDGCTIPAGSYPVVHFLWIFCEYQPYILHCKLVFFSGSAFAHSDFTTHTQTQHAQLGIISFFFIYHWDFLPKPNHL